MFARGSVLLRFGRGGWSPRRRPRGFPAAAAASHASCLARCASRRAWSSAASRSAAAASRSRRSALLASARGAGSSSAPPSRASSAASTWAAAASSLPGLRQRPVGLLRRVAGQLGPIQADDPQRHHALGGQQPQHLAEQPAQRLLMPGPEPGDRRMIGAQPAGDHPVADIAHAPFFDHPARPLALAVPIQQQRDHHLRGRTPPGHAHQPGTGGGTRPGPTRPPRPAPRTPDRSQAATRACPPAAATADHAAGKGNSAAQTMISTVGPAPSQARRLCDRLDYS
jgi:hypothetical protein